MRPLLPSNAPVQCAHKVLSPPGTVNGPKGPSLADGRRGGGASDLGDDTVRLLPINRDPESYEGGAPVLHQSPASLRTSRDVDVFRDTLERLVASAEADAVVPREAGYTVELERPRETLRCTVVSRGGTQTRIEWVFDSAFASNPSLLDEWETPRLCRGGSRSLTAPGVT